LGVSGLTLSPPNTFGISKIALLHIPQFSQWQIDLIKHHRRKPYRIANEAARDRERLHKGVKDKDFLKRRKRNTKGAGVQVCEQMHLRFVD
jgi:hypothetical protein